MFATTRAGVLSSKSPSGFVYQALSSVSAASLITAPAGMPGDLYVVVSTVNTTLTNPAPSGCQLAASLSFSNNDTTWVHYFVETTATTRIFNFSIGVAAACVLLYRGGEGVLLSASSNSSPAATSGVIIRAAGFLESDLVVVVPTARDEGCPTTFTTHQTERYDWAPGTTSNSFAVGDSRPAVGTSANYEYSMSGSSPQYGYIAAVFR